MTINKQLQIPFLWWYNYWFQPSPLLDLAICRILIVGFQLIRFASSNFWSSLVEYSKLPDFLYSPLPALQILISPFGFDYRPNLIYLAIVFWLTVLSGIFSVLGLFTNLNLFFFALGNIFIQAYLYSFRDYHHSEALVMLSLLILAFSPAGKTFSLDDLCLRIKTNLQHKYFSQFDLKQEYSSLARWPLLLIQWLFAIIYLDSAISKLLKGGLDWMNGYTLQYYLWQDGLIWDRPLGIWLAKQHTLAIISSWAAIIFELTFFLVLIFPKLIWFYIPVGISFHTGIYLAQKAPFLKYFPSYAVFIPWANILKTLSRRLQLSDSAKSLEVIYDRQSSSCLRLVSILCYFDWFNQLTFSDVETYLSQNKLEFNADNYYGNIHLILASGESQTGFLAFRKVCSYLPLLYPLSGLFMLFSKSNFSRRIYYFIAGGKNK